jgi:CubicO group peptidase (beta-lactamase class C family)
MKAKIRCTCSAAALLAGCVFAQAAPIDAAVPATSGLATRLDHILTTMVKSDGFSGSVLIAQRGNVLIDKGYGFADRRTRTSNRPGTEFRIFDLTEQFTAIAILELQERAKLHTSDALCSYVAGCAGSWKQITIQELLTHTSGIPSFTSFRGYRLSQLLSPKQIIKRAMARKLDFAPGQGFEFSPTNYILLGTVIQKLAGEPYQAFMADNVFRPLGLSHSGVLSDNQSVPRLAKGYLGAQSGPKVDATTPWADAGMYATTGDMYRWDQSLLTTRLVSQTSLDAMFTPYVAVPPETRIGYGYGWLIGPLFKHAADFHGGGAGGFQALNLIFPQDQVTIIILSNQGLTDTGSMETRLVPAIFGRS